MNPTAEGVGVNGILASLLDTLRRLFGVAGGGIAAFAASASDDAPF